MQRPDEIPEPPINPPEPRPTMERFTVQVEATGVWLIDVRACDWDAAKLVAEAEVKRLIDSTDGDMSKCECERG